MKKVTRGLLCLIFLLFRPMFAQNAGPNIVIVDHGLFSEGFSETGTTVTFTSFFWQIIKVNGVKTFYFGASTCHWTFGPPEWLYPCDPLPEQTAFDYAPTQMAYVFFLAGYGDVPHNPTPIFIPSQYQADFRVRPELTTGPPTSPSDTMVIFLDGFTTNLVEMDLTTAAVVSSIQLPGGDRTWAARPTSTSLDNEIWTVHGGIGNQISISDLSAGTVLGTIPTLLDPNNSNPTGIAFTNDCTRAFYAVSYYTPDAAGNKGALLIFDAVNRVFLSSTPLPIIPTNLLMSPDGLTAYIIGGTSSFSGEIMYCDILSGTADLTAPFPIEEVTFGATTTGPTVFIHPDGTRLLIDQGTGFGVFDLTTRKITAAFPYNLPPAPGSAVANPPGSVEMSQDGSTLAVTSLKETFVASYDTLSGNQIASFTTSQTAQTFVQPPVH